MIYMPVNATVLEIRPRSFPNVCYRDLADACSIHYYLSLGEGGKETALDANMENVRHQLRHIKAGFDSMDSV